MDPYLEDAQLWPTFHSHLVSCLYQILLPGLVDRYRARISQRRYTTEQALFTSVIREEHEEEFIEIRHRRDGRLITLIDVVSPTNKTQPGGRAAYLCTRSAGKSAQANLVEIDLVLQGEPTLDYSRENLPPWDYAVTVTRATHPEKHEIYTSTLKKRLPRFRLPLAADDRDTVLDLHVAFTRCFEQGGFASLIDYSKDPTTLTESAQRAWVDDLLHQHDLR
jgi:hypothetical protein